MTSPIYLTDSNFSTGENIHHRYFTRRGGVSKGIYESLNVGLGSNDNQSDILENRRLICLDMGIPESNLLTLYQVHSTDCLYVTSPFGESRPRCDGMVTDRPNLALGILTADCCPILFSDSHSSIIGACHSGWQGAYGNIASEIIALMESKGAKRENIRASLGPTITQKNYETGPEFFTRFIAQSPENQQFFTPSERPDHHYFDLSGYISSRLDALGIMSSILPPCTYGVPQDFFSHRRSQHTGKNGESDYGRQLSLIMLQE